MKSSITFLLFAMIQASAFAQIDLKAFLDASYVKFEKNEIRDTNYLNTKQNQLDFRPLGALAYNRRDKDFHEIGISDIQYKKTNMQSGNTNLQRQDSRSRTFSIRFNYSYNYCFLKNLQRWTPYVGLHSDLRFMKGKSNEKLSNSQQKNLQLTGSIGARVGVQYAIKDYLRLEFLLPIDFYSVSYRRTHQISSSLPFGSRTIQSASYNRIEHSVFYLPFRLGLAVRL